MSIILSYIVVMEDQQNHNYGEEQDYDSGAASSTALVEKILSDHHDFLHLTCDLVDRSEVG